MRWLTASSAITGATLIGACGIAAQLVAKQTRVASSTHTYVPRSLGSQADFAVYRPGAPSESLVSAGGPKCRYVVVVSATCGASADLEQTWNRKSPEALHLPKEWGILWLSASDKQAMVGVLPKNFPFTVYYPAPGVDVLGKLGVDVVPTHLVLDRAGRIVSGDVGAFAPDPSTLRPDCSIVTAQPHPGSGGGRHA